MKHEFEKWDGVKTTLKTCNQATKVSVTNRQAPQEVVAGGDIVFTYDVKFVVSTRWRWCGICVHRLRLWRCGDEVCEGDLNVRGVGRHP